MIIVGSGAIGVEFAHFTMLWEQVTIVEFMPNIVPVKMKTSKQMERSMKKAVKIMTSSSVEKLTLRCRCKSLCKTAKGEVSLKQICYQQLELKQTLKTRIGRVGIATDKDKILVNAYN
jgi:dihydrolipoamide dehydrogenase